MKTISIHTIWTKKEEGGYRNALLILILTPFHCLYLMYRHCLQYIPMTFPPVIGMYFRHKTWTMREEPYRYLQCIPMILLLCSHLMYRHWLQWIPMILLLCSYLMYIHEHWLQSILLTLSHFLKVLWTCVWCISWLKYLTRIYIDFHLPRYKPILINNGNNRIYFIDYCKIWYKQRYINKNLTHGNINWNNL